MATTENTRERIDNAISQFSYCMLVTENTEGELRARPMAVADHEKGGDLFFFTVVDSTKVDEIENHRRCGVTMQSGNTFLSLTGTSQVLRDKDAINSKWSVKFKPWFPEGPDTRDLALIKFNATAGEIWDQSKPLSTARYLWEMGKAVIKGQRMDSDKAVVHERADLGQGAAGTTGEMAGKTLQGKGGKDFDSKRQGASAIVGGDTGLVEE